MLLQVKSSVIWWQGDLLEIVSQDEEKYALPLDTRITVAMIGYPDKETRTMIARELGPYMAQGYIIESIEFDASAESREGGS